MIISGPQEKKNVIFQVDEVLDLKLRNQYTKLSHTKGLESTEKVGFYFSERGIM